jgi:hypothetical protein
MSRLIWSMGMSTQRARTWFAIIGSACRLCAALLWSLEPTWSKFLILRLKKTATLNGLVGDWIRMRDIYSIYMVFLVVSIGPLRHGAPDQRFAMARIDQAAR